MSYLVLARKWRPQTFSDVVGQEAVTTTLQNALKHDRVAHALLFSGPRGVGKTTVARIMAKALNCQEGPGPEPCNRCDLCKQITAGTAVDVNEIDGASNRGIDEIRQLREGIRFQPVQARFKVYIIDEVHMLTREAFNAMLKTLEEPPPHAFFIMATTEPHKVPDTILSRCQHFEFRRLPVEELATYLDTIVDKEGLGIEAEATRLLAKEAGGSVRDSLSLLDQVAAFGAKDLEQVCQALGLVSSRTLRQLAKAIVAKDVAGAVTAVSKAHEAGGDLVRLVSDLGTFLRDLALLLRLGPQEGARLTGIDQDSAAELIQEFADTTFHTILEMLGLVLSAMDTIGRSSNQRLATELLVMRLCTLSEVTGLDELLTMMATGQEGDKGGDNRGIDGPTAFKPTEPEQSGKHARSTAGSDTMEVRSTGGQGYEGNENGRDGPSPKAMEVREQDQGPKGLTSVPRADQPPWDTDPEDRQELVNTPAGQVDQTPSMPRPSAPDRGGVSPADHGKEIDPSGWQAFVDWVMRKRPSLGAALGTGTELIRSGVGRIEISCSGICRDILSDSDNARLLDGLAEEFFGPGTRVVMGTRKKGGSSTAQGHESRAAARKNRKEALLDTPLVKEALEIFQARVSSVNLYKPGGKGRGGKRPS